MVPYGDGANFHWDYYNSFVIQPMLIEVLAVLKTADTSARWNVLYTTVLKRAQRYAAYRKD
jgi:hypothetical protein